MRMTISIMPGVSCLYCIFSGATLDNISGKSSMRPGSYSIVVTAPVEPEIKTVEVHFLCYIPLLPVTPDL